jgi:hypothetical protein
VFELLTGAGRLKIQKAAKTTTSATTEGIIIFIGLKLAGVCGGGIADVTGTVTGARREAGAGASSLTRTTVISSGSSLICEAAAALVISDDGVRRIVIPEAITRSSISSATD